MKKLVVLTLVLGLASLANAALSLEYNGLASSGAETLNLGGTAVIGINDSIGVSQISYLDVKTLSGGLFTLSNAQLGPAAGDGPTDLLGPYDATAFGVDGWETEVTTAWLPGSGFGGTTFSIDLLAIGDGEIVVDLVDGSTFEILETMTITVPEPITMALLGLGGLFLRRRK